MSRFYDHLRRHSDAVEPELAAKLGGAMVIDATNLSDFLYANEAKGEWDLIKDFFNLAPPFEKFFVECRAPKELLTKHGMVPWPEALPKEWGVLFLATDVTKLTQEERDRLMGFGDEVPKNIRWVLQAVLFAETPKLPTLRTAGKIREQFTWWFPVMADGSQPTGEPRPRSIQIEYIYNKNLMPEPKFTETSGGRGVMEMTPEIFNLVNAKSVDSGCRFWYPDGNTVPLNEGMTPEEWDRVVQETTTSYIRVLSLQEDIFSMKPSWQFQYTIIEEQYWLPLLQPCLMAVCFMHVKNVKTEKVVPDEAVQRKARKRYGEPLCTYHVLQVQPFRKVLEAEGRVAQTGIRQALSICRGHFHHYGDKFGKGKLFGKYSGMFWVPTHLRGSVEQGMVDKSYKMETTGANKQ